MGNSILRWFFRVLPAHAVEDSRSGVGRGWRRGTYLETLEQDRELKDMKCRRKWRTHLLSLAQNNHSHMHVFSEGVGECTGKPRTALLLEDQISATRALRSG